jgi:hypothetical protein
MACRLSSLEHNAVAADARPLQVDRKSVGASCACSSGVAGTGAPRAATRKLAAVVLPTVRQQPPLHGLVELGQPALRALPEHASHRRRGVPLELPPQAGLARTRA